MVKLSRRRRSRGRPLLTYRVRGAAPRDGFLLPQEWLPLIPEAALHRNHPAKLVLVETGSRGLPPLTMRRPVSTTTSPSSSCPRTRSSRGWRVWRLAVCPARGEPVEPHERARTRPKDGFLLSQEWVPLISEAALHRNHPCEACPRGNGEQGSTASYYAAPRIHHHRHAPPSSSCPRTRSSRGGAGVVVSRMLRSWLACRTMRAGARTRPKDGFLLLQEWLPLIPEAALHRNHPCEACPRGNGEQGSTATP